MTAPDAPLFGPADAAHWIAVPGDDDDKYSRGVVGFVTGSAQYPGAAVLGVEAAARTGVGMIRYLGVGPGSCCSGVPRWSRRRAACRRG